MQNIAQSAPAQAVKNALNNVVARVEGAIANLVKSVTSPRLEVGTATQLAKTQQVGMMGLLVSVVSFEIGSWIVSMT